MGQLLQTEGNKLLDLPNSRIEKISDHVLITKYRRSGLKGPVLVQINQIFTPRQEIAFSLSYKELEIALWKLVGAEVGQSSHENGRRHSCIHPYQSLPGAGPAVQQQRHSPAQCSADTRLRERAALLSLKKNYKPGYADKKAGVMLMGIGEAQVAQGSLMLEHGAGHRSDGLMQAMDALNRRYGHHTVSLFASSVVKS